MKRSDVLGNLLNQMEGDRVIWQSTNFPNVFIEPDNNNMAVVFPMINGEWTYLVFKINHLGAE